MPLYVQRDGLNIVINESEQLPTDNIICTLKDGESPPGEVEPKNGIVEDIQKTQADLIYQLVIGGLI